MRLSRLAALGLSLTVDIEQQLQQSADQQQLPQQHQLIPGDISAAAVAATKSVAAVALAVARASKTDGALAARTLHDAEEADAAAADVLLQWSKSCRATCESAAAAAAKPVATTAAARKLRDSVQAHYSKTSAALSCSSSSVTLPKQFVAYAVSAGPRTVARSITEEAVAREWAAAARGAPYGGPCEDSEDMEEGWLCSNSSSSSLQQQQSKQQMPLKMTHGE